VGEWFQHLRLTSHSAPLNYLTSCVEKRWEAIIGDADDMTSAPQELWIPFLTAVFMWMDVPNVRWQCLARVRNLRPATPLTASVVSKVIVLNYRVTWQWLFFSYSISFANICILTCAWNKWRRYFTSFLALGAARSRMCSVMLYCCSRVNPLKTKLV
jgi:hypothetical protein